MANAQLTVEEVMERIREAMKAKRSMVSARGAGGGLGGSEVPAEGEFSRLEAELRQSNLKWNVNAEYPITSHRKTIGRFIVFGKKVVRKFLRWYVNPPVDQQREFNGSVTRALNLLGELARNQSLALRGARDRIQELENLLNDIGNQFAELSSAGAGLGALSDGLQDKADRNDVELLKEYLAGKVGAEELEEVRGLLDSKADESKLEAIRDMLADKAERSELDSVRASVLSERNEVLALADEQAKRRLEPELMLVADRLRRLERRINKGLHIEPGVRTVERLVREDKEENPDIDYFLFEQRFRGSREDIKERQRVYLDYFKGKSKVLDIGCGRGEFVELLQENGIGVQGIDINEDMVGYCQDRGLPVLQADLFSYLEGLEDNSLDGIFAAQVIEHLKPNSLVRFMELTHLKLKCGGILMVETINPHNISAVCTWFNMDISHEKPILPETLSFLSECAGFKILKQLDLHPDELSRIPEGGDVRGQDGTIIQLVNRFNYLFYSAHDYALILSKGVICKRGS
ncbi:Methionine biosynthesis MetW [Acididesulfobacillus acetoxydans]|uniref:Methionine biosynthesis MetW n=1 Tax=Acididesulfobacillus acetoxydans TaxID=1561005 RepID=A0A8S0WVG6_9FIRM|nr:class I SAM-dependent methyltransferase [Acididesulfobacillus acetoxydans]CAA7599571.1 Methionine biosynthesis MetW [Acididesulfobacillus acetoxydans]CEJ07766.1 Methionine biosynthesis protein MetW [Acididesulfobacillus acetoxydans]